MKWVMERGKKSSIVRGCAMAHERNMVVPHQREGSKPKRRPKGGILDCKGIGRPSF